MQTVKVGIIGIGGIAFSRHITELLESPNAEITAVCDINPRALKKAQEKLGLRAEKCYTDYHDLINDPDVEAIEVCTPNDLHVEMGIAALQAGKPVNVEKPLSVNFETASALIEAEKESSAFGMTCFTYRYTPAVRYAKMLADEGILGDIVGLNISYLKNSGLWENRRLEWRFVKERAGSGVIGDLCVHLVDLAQLLAGNIRQICATREIVIKERKKLDSEELAPVGTEDQCSLLVRFDSGATASIHITRCALGHSNTIRYDVYGTKGSFSFDLNDSSKLIVCTGEGDPKNFKFRTLEVPASCYLTQEQAFVNAVRGNRDPLFPSLQAGLQSQKIVDAIISSADENCWVSL